MANVDAAFGAKAVRHLTGGSIRANEYKIVNGFFVKKELIYPIIYYI